MAAKPGADLVGELEARVKELVADNERLRVHLDNMTEEQHELDRLLGRLTAILSRTANTLKGEPDELTWHDWSDLPYVAGALVRELNSYHETDHIQKVTPEPKS